MLPNNASSLMLKSIMKKICISESRISVTRYQIMKAHCFTDDLPQEQLKRLMKLKKKAL